MTDVKIADTQFPILDLIKQRWSPRAFDKERPLSSETILSLLEAARWTASSNNQQPWNFIVGSKVDSPEAYDKLLETLMDGNRIWAQDAPVLMIGAAAKLNKRGNPNGHARYDLGQSVAMLTLQALSMGIYLHQMGGFFPDKATELFNIPDTHEPVVAIALGYLGSPDQLTEWRVDAEQKPRERKPLAEWTHGATWGDTPDFVSEAA